MNYFELEIKPKSAPRPRCRMINKKIATPYMPKDYMRYKENVRILIKRHRIAKYEGLIALEIEFIFKMPKSWSKKKQAEVLDKQNVTNNKDVDNLAKGVMDAMNELLFGDDRQVVKLDTSKLYGIKDQINVKIQKFIYKKYIKAV